MRTFSHVHHVLIGIMYACSCSLLSLFYAYPQTWVCLWVCVLYSPLPLSLLPYSSPPTQLPVLLVGGNTGHDQENIEAEAVNPPIERFEKSTKRTS